MWAYADTNQISLSPGPTVLLTQKTGERMPASTREVPKPRSRYNAPVTVEIIVIGNEVLLGFVQDTNSSYLCRIIRGRGGRVSHIAVVADQPDSIAREINSSIS